MNIQCTFCIFVSWRTFAVVILSADICPFYGNDYLFDCKTPSGVFMAVHFPSGDHVANWINWSVFSVYYNWISIAKHKNELKGTNDLMGNTYILNIFLNNPIIYILTYKLYNFLRIPPLFRFQAKITQNWSYTLIRYIINIFDQIWYPWRHPQKFSKFLFCPQVTSENVFMCSDWYQNDQ